METVDLTKVAGFKALDSDGNELGIVSMEQLTDSIAMRIADGLSERTVLPANNLPMAVAATSTGSDKMETAFSETTDPAYVRVIDKNGNSAKQGISSLASVVGGLLNPFLIKQTLQSGVDLNTITEIGMYRLNGLCTNAPFSQSWGTLIVIPNNSSKPSQIVTLLTSDSFGIFARKEVNMAWYKINTSAV